VDELTAIATQQLTRIKVVLGQLGLSYVELPAQMFGVGVAVGFSETDYCVLSIMGGGSEGQLMVTSGIAKDINRDQMQALEVANLFNQRNSSHTVYLHDAEAGWSLLCQRTTPLEVFLDVPQFLEAVVRGIPSAAREMRDELRNERTLGGQDWQWTAEDHQGLLFRSMI